MDQPNPTPPPTSATGAVNPQTGPPVQAQPLSPLPQDPPQVPTPSSTTTPSISTSVPPSPNPNPNPNSNPSLNLNPKPQTQFPPHQSSLQHSQSLPGALPNRPPATLARAWQQPHLPSSSSSVAVSAGPSSSSPPTLPSTSAAPTPRGGGIALGVPAHRPTTSPSQPAPFSSTYGHFGGLGRSGVSLPEPSSNPSASQVRPSMQGVQGMGMLGSINSSSQMRPGGIPAHHQQRPVQSSLRPVSTPSNQLPSSQNYQGPGLLRVSSAVSPSSPSPTTSQGVQSPNQPWLASGSQGKPPLPTPSFRQPVTSQSLQQRSHIQQQPHHSVPLTSQQQHMSSLQQQQQPSPSQPAHEHYGQQVPQSRVQQVVPHQQQITRVQSSANQKSSTPASASLQPSTAISVPQSKIAATETDETCNRILSKRSIHELVNQIDPSEKLDPEVEDILMDIADDFVESITTFGCSLAKHRKSTTLEAKDILIHLERNWNIALPGFAGDEIKSYRKPLVNDTHKERLAAIKKSIVSTETTNTRQATGNAKGSLVKAPANVIGSPNVKI
ncbi:transcription initiation factor TFIID subunit 12 [Humulus lupulus]|uniref:transcription initiation factor TFIID subunit 12 n=1 Tax=Humulus lupulus TaxID=3486 RepID=UPI002B414722|nr:transcription initiation factor TFIID subunit 12 [Humulus lupulus]